MSPSQPSAAAGPVRQRRLGATLGAFVVGLPVAAGILWLVHRGPLQGTLAQRYVTHPVEYAEVVLFGCALGTLALKFLGWFAERAAFRANLVPPWDGKTVGVAEAVPLLAELEKRPQWLQTTYLGRRLANALDFLRCRGSATAFDDQLRTLADNDFLSLEASYGLTRFITWAIPILGFLGTVLGITEAIAGVTPEELERSLHTVTDGLALAFDTTALALLLTMTIMLFTFLMERLEQTVLENVDQLVERHLAHRFERAGTAGGEFLETVRQHSQVMLQATEQLVQKQVELWSKSLTEAGQQHAELHKDLRQGLTAALETVLETTLEAHARRLADLEKQAAQQNALLLEKLGSLTRLTDRLAAQTEALAAIQDGETQLIRLQERLQQNLEALADAGAFQQAVHSLTAAMHLFTSQLSTVRRPGAAA